jgi:trehalose-phosphatase
MSKRLPAPNLLIHRDEALASMRGVAVGLFVDFDGTISEFAEIPDQAIVSPRAAASLRRLADSLPLVCVISGRSASDLREKVGLSSTLYIGNHGAEQLESGRLTVAEGASDYPDAIAALLDRLEARVDIPGIVWENKRYSAAVHIRGTEDPERARSALATALIAELASTSLQVFWGKMILEIRPPTGLHKGHAIARLIAERGLEGAIFVGDDRTDLDALVALRDMGDLDGLRGLGVAVVDRATPRELVNAADYLLQGVPEVEEFLEWLAAMEG